MHEQYIRKITWIGLFINTALAGFKFAAGIFGNSQAVVADAVHSLSDSATDIAVIAGSYYWARPADDDHPYGHRRFETVVTIFIGFMLLLAGGGIAWKAIATHNMIHQGPPGVIALAAAAVSIVCKEILYQWTVKAGQKIKSPALRANAWHHRIDALSSIPAFIAVGGAILAPSLGFLDHVGALVVSLMIMHAAAKIIWPGLQELTDAGAPRDVCDKIKDIANEHKDVMQIHGVRTRYASNRLQVDFHIVVDGSMTVREGHGIAEDVREKLINSESDILDVVIHVEPQESARFEDDDCT